MEEKMKNKSGLSRDIQMLGYDLNHEFFLVFLFGSVLINY